MDITTKEKALELVEELQRDISFFKIGLQFSHSRRPRNFARGFGHQHQGWLDLKPTTSPTPSREP